MDRAIDHTGATPSTSAAPEDQTAPPATDDAEPDVATMLTELLHSVTHDFRSPLVTIRGFVNELRLALDDLKLIARDPRPSASDADRMLWLLQADIPTICNFIDEATGRADGMLQQFQVLARAARPPREVREVEVRALVEELEADLADSLADRHCVFEYGNLPVLQTDAAALGDVLMQVTVDALARIPRNGTGRITIDGRWDAQSAAISIADNGPTPGPQEQQRIYAPIKPMVQRQDRPPPRCLAYARIFAQCQGGHLSLRPLQPGLEVTLHLPGQ